MPCRFLSSVPFYGKYFMSPVKTRSQYHKHEPYPLNEFQHSLIETLAKRFVHLRAVGVSDMSGDQFSRIFADSISGQEYGRPLGVADVAWNGCCWSVKTVKTSKPHVARHCRLISGRNSPDYSAGISNPRADLERTGRAVLEVYNSRIHEAREQHDDVRLVVLIRNMQSQEFTLFERPLVPVVVNNYTWGLTKKKNLIGVQDGKIAFTWQPHGSQFTVHEPIPQSATRFYIRKLSPTLTVEQVIRLTGFKPDWVQFVD